MPKDNNQGSTNPPSNSDDNFPVFVEETLPPMPQEKPIEQPTPEKPEDINVPTVQTPVPVENAGTASPMDDAILPPIVTSKNKEKKSTGKIIATILGLFLLVGGIGAGVLLVNQNQDIREKADESEINDCEAFGNTCRNSCLSSEIQMPALCDFGSNKICCAVKTSTPIPSKLPNGNPCSSNDQCISNYCDPVDKQCKDRPSENCPKVPSCQVDHLGEESYCGGVDDQYWCTNIIGDWGVLKCSLPNNECEKQPNGTYTYDAGTGYCLDTTHNVNCDAGERCSDEPDPRCIGSTPTSSPIPQASCTSVKAYATDWTYIQPINLPSLKAGDSVNFCVLGTSSIVGFDKAKVTVNATTLGETTNKRPSSDDFCSLYTIPEGTNTFNITAQIHHATLGWK